MVKQSLILDFGSRLYTRREREKERAQERGREGKFRRERERGSRKRELKRCSLIASNKINICNKFLFSNTESARLKLFT